MQRSIHIHDELENRIRETYPPDVKNLKSVLSELMQAGVVQSFEYLPDADPADHGHRYDDTESGVLVVEWDEQAHADYGDSKDVVADISLIGEICADCGVYPDY